LDGRGADRLLAAVNHPLFICGNDELWGVPLGTAAEEEKGERKKHERGEAEGKLAHSSHHERDGQLRKSVQNRFEGPVCGDSLTAKGFLRANLMYKEVLLCDSDGEISAECEKK
jgi:hypothetical protein